jgi:formylglycine-generating enzyme required for sulfatase activity
MRALHRFQRANAWAARMPAALAMILLALALATPAEARRVALVIGIDAYRHLAPLQKAVADARAIAAVLKDDLGFDQVLTAENASRREMNRRLTDLDNVIRSGDTVAFFFSGHGVAVGGENILLPADMPKPGHGEESLVRDEGFPVGRIVRRIQARGAKVTFMILDACRDNPFEQAGVRSIGGTRGLGRVEVPQGVFLLYAAGYGQTALDRLPGNDPVPTSVFTRHLIPALRTPGLTQVEIAKRVQSEVDALARTVPHQQQPAYYDQIVGTIVLKPGAAPAATPPGPSAGPGAPSGASEVVRLCREVSGIESVGVLEAMARQHVGTPAGDCISARLGELKRAVAAERQRVALLDQQRREEASRPAPPAPVPQRPASSASDPALSVRPGSGQSFRDCPTCPEMVVVPAGSFRMGSPEGEAGRDSNEGPVRTVRIGAPFAVGRTHVTRGEFAAFVRETGHRMDGGCHTWTGKWELKSEASWQSPGFAQGDDHPVVCVNWVDAQAYVRWLGSRTGKGYRLLSEAEAEYAARGITRANVKHPRFWWGDGEKEQCGHANGADATAKSDVPGASGWSTAACRDGHAYTSPVGSFRANGFGLHDAAGNVWTWTEDCWIDHYRDAPTDGSARTTGDCNLRVVRGGSWSVDPQFLRAADRLRGTSGFRSSVVGFRLARSVSR